MPETKDITVAYGDGIGPEIMEAVLAILVEAKAKLNIETIHVGERIYLQGASSGILPAAWETLRRTKVLLKAPITTPQGGGYKSLNVTMRKTLGLYANVRPTIAYAPFVKTHHPKMDLCIIRENEEDLYAGIEYRQSDDVYQSLKIITRSGSERIMRYAFDYAVQNGRKKVTCMSKDNIMKMADGCFHKVFDEVGKEYPQIEKDHFIIDIGAARIASRPEIFDVIVTENLYGDIISDIAADVSGSVGLAGSSNIGADFAMFEAIHGSAPDIAGKNMANPSGLLQAAVMMLVHVGQPEVAATIQNAWLKTIEDGIHTGDIYGEKSKEKVGTKEFSAAVMARLGQKPGIFAPASFTAQKTTKTSTKSSAPKPAEKKLVGVDIFIHWMKGVDALGKALKKCECIVLKLNSISSKGLKVWPDANVDTALTDQFCCRYKGEGAAHADIAGLLKALSENDFDFVKTEHLYTFDGVNGFTLGQGE